MESENGFDRLGRITIFVVVSLLFCQAAWAVDPTIIYESATQGATGQTSGYGIDGSQFIGSRFYLSEEREITAIGGHLTELAAGNVFGAIISLSSIYDLPTGSPFVGPEVVASTVFDAPYPSTDFRTPLSVTLPAGFYALVFGTDDLGASGGLGVMPSLGQVEIENPTFIIWTGVGWFEAEADPPPRLVVEGVADYCISYGDCSDSYISRVTVGEIDNSTGCHIYSDHRSLSTTMYIGDDYPITVVNGDGWPGDECRVWIDWDHDLDFEGSEENVIMTGSGGEGPYTATITPPVDAVVGDTRMRISIIAEATVSPCGQNNKGEVEDYTINMAIKQYGGGFGTANDPFRIYTAEDMQAIGADPNDWYKHFKLMDDIDLIAYSGTSYNVIGTSSSAFTGVFDGNGHTISNFNYYYWELAYDRDNIGLFGYVDGVTAEIKDLGLIDPNLKVNGENNAPLVGCLADGNMTGCYVLGGIAWGSYGISGMVGHNGGTISNCYSTAGGNGVAAIASLVGYNVGTITACYAGGHNYGAFYVAGLVGDNSVGIISDCYSTSTILGIEHGLWYGGLVGYNHNGGQIVRCYSSGVFTDCDDIGGLVGSNSVSGIVTDSFWDVNSSGVDTSEGGEGKTTAEMQSALTFTSSGWDFVTPVWEICEGTNYPKLAWEIPMTVEYLCPDGIDLLDYAFLAARWKLDDCDGGNDYCDRADVDKDGDVDGNDLRELIDNWLTGK